MAGAALLSPLHAQDLPLAEYAAHRAAARARMKPHSVAVFRSAQEFPRTASSDFPFRQANNLLYLTGYTEQFGTLVLFADSVTVGAARATGVLFVRQRDRGRELWNGARLGPAEAAQTLGIATLPSDSLDAVLGRALSAAETLYYDWISDGAQDALPLKFKFTGREQEKDLKEKFPSIAKVMGTGVLTDSLRSIKSDAEIALMQKAIDASCRGHHAAERAAKSGMFEYELAAEFDRAIEAAGAEALAYPDIVGSGPNACTLHYESNRRKIEPHELVLMDCGAEYHGYAADVTRTFPVDGTFTAEQRAIYALVLKAQSEGIAMVKPGAPMNVAHMKALEVITEGLHTLGILSADSSVRRYFPHGTSHTLGLDVHDTRGGDTLRTGMVITVEPGIYVPAESPCDRKWWNIGVRIEDDVLVTRDGNRVLSDCIPKSIKELEGRE